MYYKIPYGKAFFSISKTSGFQYAQLVYDDYDNHVYNISRNDIVGRSLVQLFEDTNRSVRMIHENQKTFLSLTRELEKIDEEDYTPEDLLKQLNYLDKEIVTACNLPDFEVNESPNFSHMRFNLKDGARVLFNFNENIGFTSLHVQYEQGYSFTLVRNQLIYKTIDEHDKTIKQQLRKTAESRENLAHIIHLIFRENSMSDSQELLETLKKYDPIICCLCSIV